VALKDVESIEERGESGKWNMENKVEATSGSATQAQRLKFTTEGAIPGQNNLGPDFCVCAGQAIPDYCFVKAAGPAIARSHRLADW
jgi:hypothetical protein